MKISYNWLKEYIPLEISASELEDKLTFAGIEVEAVEELGKSLTNIIIARIEEKEEHPNADKLSVCQVFDGKNRYQIVCGAPNCAQNQKVALAPVGTVLADFQIKKVKIRGIESFGMICSEKELGLSENHEGIMVLPEDAPLGESLADYLRIADFCFELEITPNRPDLLGIIGIARDLSAVLNKQLRIPSIQLKESSDKIENHLHLINKAPELCRRYTARMIRGVTIKESPTWLKQRLISVGLRPINNVVDITNFVMMEFGHPLHAFDYNMIENKRIVIRRAEKGEIFPALDEEKYQLQENDLVIADDKKAIALAGIIGGTNSHITETTRDVIIEAANFLYSNIRKTSSRLKIYTDSSYRFERNLADETAELVSQRAAQLILEIAGGELLNGVLDSFPNPEPKKEIILRKKKVKDILTLDLSTQAVIKYLEPLGLDFRKEEKEELHFLIPSYRQDLEREIDLIEEIIRLHGFNKVKSNLKLQSVMNSPQFYAKRRLADFLVENGFSEVKNWNFADPGDLDKLKIPADDIRRQFAKLKNPLGSSFSIMQSLLLPNLLANARFNINHGQKDLKLFEMAKVFRRDKQKLAEEEWHISSIICGNFLPTYWRQPSEEVNFYDLKGIVEGLLDIIPLKDYQFKECFESYYQPGLKADVYWQGKIIANLGKLDPRVLEKFEIDQKILSFDLNLSQIFAELEFSTPAFGEIPKFPPVLRDLSFIISKQFPYKQIVHTIRKVSPQFIKEVELFDVYTGKNIPIGSHSLSFSIIFCCSTKTLTDEFVNKIFHKIVEQLQQDFQIIMR
jgi:phenylalanyl-tRNA synthetase beta chain